MTIRMTTRPPRSTSAQKIEGKPSVPARTPPRTGPMAMENCRTVLLSVFESK